MFLRCLGQQIKLQPKLQTWLSVVVRSLKYILTISDSDNSKTFFFHIHYSIVKDSNADLTVENWNFKIGP